MNVIDVEFTAADGTILRGTQYEVDSSSPVPGVVMTHGFSAVIEMGLAPYAEAICQAGCSVLMYDHRGFGISDGLPRQQLNPWVQMADMADALTWLGGQRGVDASRVGLWGSSFAGGEVLILAALDTRVKAVVANVPYAGNPGEDYGHDTSDVVTEIGRELDRRRLAADPAPATMGPFAVVDEPGNDLPVFLEHPESSEWFLRTGAGTSWHNEVVVANAFGTEPPFDPGYCAAHLRCPSLFVVASEDRVAEAAIAVAAQGRAPEPTRLVMLDGDHFVPYGGSALQAAAGAAAEWFSQHL